MAACPTRRQNGRPAPTCQPHIKQDGRPTRQDGLQHTPETIRKNIFVSTANPRKCGDCQHFRTSDMVFSGTLYAIFKKQIMVLTFHDRERRLKYKALGKFNAMPDPFTGKFQYWVESSNITFQMVGDTHGRCSL